MNVKLLFSQIFLIGALLIAVQADPVDDTESTEDLVANWEALAEERTQKVGKQIYDQAISEVTTIKDEDPMKAASLFFKAAELCRDLNDVRHAITLFELAIEFNPEDPHFRRVYGDYLIGYRGLEEQAWAQLYKARELAKKNPEKVDEAFTKTLNRSIHIFRRDTTDGVRTFERNRSDGALIYEDENITITGGLDTLYKKMAKDPLDLSTEFFRASGLYSIGRRIETSETLASFLLRTPNSNLPAVRFSYFNVSAFEGTKNVDGVFDRINDSAVLELEKTFIIKNDLFLEGDAALVYQNQQLRGDYVDDDYWLDLVTAINLRQEWGTRDGIVRLNVGGDYSRNLYDFEAYPKHSQLISLRNSSFFENPADNSSRQRFRGRRSSSQEIGLRRAEIRYESTYPTVKEENWSFFVSNEELGLADGIWDLYTTYIYRERNLSDGTGEGSYSIHEFKVEPIWVPVFDLYDNDFVTGWEFVTVGFPITANTDEGPYDRFTSGITFRGQYVVSQAKLTLGISAGIEYANYTEADQEDFGGFIRVSIF